MKMGSLLGKRVIFYIILLSLLTFGIGIAIFQKRENADSFQKPEESIRPVKVIYLKGLAPIETRSFPGVVQATRETDLAFRVGGPLIEFDVIIGQRVEKGDVIARIDPRDFRVNVMRLSAVIDEARAKLKAMRTGARAEDIASFDADLSAAGAQLIEAEKSFSRHKRLVTLNAVSQAQHDHALAVLDTARARVDAMVQALKKARKGARIEDIEAAEAGIRRLMADLNAEENALKDTHLIAPYTGYIYKKYVENFEYVEDGDAIVSLLDFSNVEVHTMIPEEWLIRRSEFETVTCTLDAYPGHVINAKIHEIGRKTEKASQSYPLSVYLELKDNLVVEPGMAATLNIELRKPDQSDTIFRLPLGAVFAGPGDNSCVWRADPQSMRVSRSRVTVGELSHGTIFITNGLNAGDYVVTAGAKFLRENQKIRFLNNTPSDAS